MAIKDSCNQKNFLKQYFDEIKKYNLLTQAEEVSLAKRIEKGDKEAYNKMINCNLRLVVNIAKKYITPEWNLADLIQEGNIGLIKAVKKFNYRKNVRFSTYACWWIKQSITRSMSNKRRAIRLPHRKEETLRKINRTSEELSQKLNRKPTIKEIANILGYDELLILNLKSVSDKMTSIDEDINETGCSYTNFLDDETYSPEYIMNRIDLTKETSEVLEKLKDKEREIIKLRYAFENRKKKTLKTIAKDLGISPETVRQIEIRATKKIKENFSYLKDYLFC
jgi:RNA polymerase primary sigma factor